MRRMKATDAMGKPRPTHARSSMLSNLSYTATCTSAAMVVSKPFNPVSRFHAAGKLPALISPYSNAPR